MVTRLDRVLSQPHAIEVLVTVGDNPGIGKYMLVKGKGRSAKICRVNELTEAGLLIEHTSNIGRITKSYTLSETGELFYKLWKGFEEGVEYLESPDL